jgi:proline iminopeptidase
MFHIERALSELVPPRTTLPPVLDDPLPATPFMEAHYFLHGCFLSEGALLAGAPSLRGIPGVIVQARYDSSAPLRWPIDWPPAGPARAW